MSCPPDHGRPGATYADAGVSLAAADSVVGRLKDIVAKTARPEVRGSIGGFGGSFALDVARYRRPVLVSATDGVGTKMLIAQSVGRFDTVGVDLVAMCVDDLVCVGAEPLFFLDYVATGRLDPETLVEVVEGIAWACTRVGCALIGGETAEHPGAMPDDQLDLAGFAVGVVEEGEELGEARVRPGDVLIGLRSPGLRSNGYSLARHVLLERAGLRLDGPAWDGAPRSLGDELLEPSILYAPAVQAARRSVGDGLHAAAHVTGGGLAGNLGRVLPSDCDALVERGAWVQPRIFTEIARLGTIEPAEMARVFNLGIGMVLIADPSHAEAVAAATASEEVQAMPIGEVVAGSGEVVERWS